MATRRHRRARLPAPPVQVTVVIDHERSLTPHQQAAWEWFVQEVHVRLARRRQQTPTTPPAEPQP